VLLLNQLNRRTANLVRLIGLVLISWSVVSSDRFGPGSHGRALVVSVSLAICVVAALAWIVRPMEGRGLTPEIWGLAIAGGFLTEADPNSAASAFVFVAIVSAGIRAELPRGGFVVVAAALSLGIAVLIYDGGALGLLAYTLGFSAALLGATNARQSVDRADQAELLLAQTQRSHEEQLRSARLEDSTRIAREIHDVLAHALAGLTIQLEATSALLEQGADPGAIKPRVDRALELAREGLRETRRAVGALRGDTAAEAPDEDDGAGVSPTVRIEALVTAYRDAAPNAAAQLTIDGDASRLTGELGETIVRVLQEALTNVRKHAPGADVTVAVAAGDAVMGVVVEDRGGASAAADGLAASGGGYGVRGMRERAEQLGGMLEAGPTETGWRVELRIPRSEG
jgi:signal transduction histidine kinase